MASAFGSQDDREPEQATEWQGQGMGEDEGAR